jgi:hypothetical protein
MVNWPAENRIGRRPFISIEWVARAAHSPSGDSCPTDNGRRWGACCFLLLWMAYGQRFANGALWLSVRSVFPFSCTERHGGCTEGHRGGPCGAHFPLGRYISRTGEINGLRPTAPPQAIVHCSLNGGRNGGRRSGRYS